MNQRSAGWDSNQGPLHMWYALKPLDYLRTQKTQFSRKIIDCCLKSLVAIFFVVYTNPGHLKLNLI